MSNKKPTIQELEKQVHDLISDKNPEKSEEKLDYFLNISPYLVLIINPKGKVIKINKSCKTILGYSQKEILDIDLWSLIHPDDVKKTIKASADQSKGKRIINFINRYKNKDGLYRTLEWQTTVVKDGFTYAFGQDITVRNEALKKLAIQNEEKEKRVDELGIANKELDFLNEEKEKKADELGIANKELDFLNQEKEKRADELGIANKELDFQNEEKEKRADELGVATKELDFQNEEKEKRAQELVIANKELAFQNEEKEKRANELIITNKVLAFQNEEKEKRADELIIANKELAFQNEEKEKRADELIIANKELAFQNEEKDKRADELAIANKEKDKRADELAIANKEKGNREYELILANEEKEKRADELVLANKELAFQNELAKNRTESESIAKELRQFIETANAPIFGIDSKGLVNEWNETSEKITGFKKEEVLGKDLVETYITEDYRGAVKQVLDNALKGKETANYQFPLFTKDGKRVIVLLNSSTRRDTAGKIVGVLGVGQDISEIDKLRTESESIAKELRQFIETANAPIFGIDSKGLVNEWNQTSEKITGFKKEEVLGKDLVETYITEDYRDAVKQVLDNALKGKETANYEFPLFTKDGKRVMVLLNSSTRRNAAGEIVGVLGVGQDISEMDKLRTESESIAKELRQFIETANAPIFGIDSKGLVNEWNQTSEKITGFKKEEVLGKDLVETYITEDYRDAVKQVLDNALKGKETANYEFPLFTKDGKRVMVLLNSSTRRNAAGEIVGVLGVGQDITILNEYKENLEFKVINRTQELAFENDEKDKRAAELVIANKELAFQNNEKEKRADELIIANKELAFQNEEKEKRADELGIANKELDFQNEEKEKRAQELGIANKELAFQNEEKEKRAQELGIANKELEQFSFLASHDLQEPLRTVINYMEVFEEDYYEILDETARKYLGSVRNATERMRILIKSLLDFSRLGRNRSFEYIDCRKLINEAIADLNSMIKASNAIIEISEMPTLSLYQIEVRELFQNLIMNAIKFQKQGQQPIIQIQCEEIDNVWKFSIIDNGIGIDPIYFERIFDIFQRLHTNDEYEGTGIGLANCKKIVQLHQGEIWLESTIGKGTSFYFTIHT